MATKPAEDITQILVAAKDGDVNAEERLFEIVHAKLREVAHCELGKHRRGHTWQRTDLVHETFLRLGLQDLVRHAPNRKYLFGAVARSVERVLVDHARKRSALKRGGDRKAIPLDDITTYFEDQHVDVLTVREALAELKRENERSYDCITWQLFAGCTVDEIASTLGLSSKTVEGTLRHARAWLHLKLGCFNE